MAKLRIAFCGPNYEGKEKLVNFARHLLNREFSVVLEPSHVIGSLDSGDWAELHAVNWRILEELNLSNQEIVFSPSCGIDQVVNQAVRLAKLATKATAIALPESYRDVDVSGINKTGSVLQVILNQTEQEVVDWWTHVYAVLPATSVLSVTQDDVLTQYDDFLKSVPAFSSVTRIPDDLTSAQDFLKKEAEVWMQHLDS